MRIISSLILQIKRNCFDRNGWFSSNSPFFDIFNLSPRSSHQYKARIPPPKDGGIVRNIFAVQLTLINGRSRRGLRLWIARATSSFPVPVSPKMKTVEPVGATTLTCLHKALNAALRPMIPPRVSSEDTCSSGGHRSGDSRASGEQDKNIGGR